MERVSGAEEPAQRLLVSLGFLSLYFVLFNVALLARPAGLKKRVTLLFAALNWLGFIALGSHEVWLQSRPQLLSFLGGTAVALLVAAGIAKVREAALLVATYLVLATVTLAFACFEQQQGTMLVLSLSGLSVAAVVGARLLQSEGLRVTAFLVQGVALAASAMIAEAAWWLPAVLALGFIACERLNAGAASRGVTSSLSALGAAVALMRFGGEVMPANLATLAWVVAAFVAMAVGFVVRERAYRLSGLGMLALALGRLFVLDLSELPMDRRILTFILLGVILLAISFAYTRLRHRLEQWM
jgi:hypothetical protein